MFMGIRYDADATSHAPSAVRDWVLGAIVHSRPIVIDYYDPTDISVLLKRYVVVGANDGMIHVFDDTNSADASYGKEVFAFIPEDLLTKLQNLPDNPFVDMVDGQLLLYRSNTAPKYLIFGERIGGSKFWCLDISDKDPLNWTFKWNYTNTEIQQSWSQPTMARIPVSVDASTGERTFKDVLVITGGYDSTEDLYPEPFNDNDNSGSPYKTTGGIDSSEWDKNDDTNNDINSNNDYDTYNLTKDIYGRGIFIFDIDDPTAVTTDGNGNQILPVSISYGAANSSDANGAVQTLTDMKWCFPADPSVITGSYIYNYKNAGVITEARKSNVLASIYATDIYANVYRIDYTFTVDPDDLTTDNHVVDTNTWTVKKVFSGNPGSSSGSGHFDVGLNTSDQGRKVFYSPAVSWGGSCTYFTDGNYRYSNTSFYGTGNITSLFFGTGDREHPTYTMVKDRFYAVYDDSTVSAAYDPTGVNTAISVTSVPYTENNLLNLTCDELDSGTTLSGLLKSTLQENLTDDPSYTNNTLLENGATNEDDAKGWYIVLEDQGDSAYCSHCTYPSSVTNTIATDRDYHIGEKILAKAQLYAGILYFTSYQPSVVDPCSPQGNGYSYALNYCDATSAYNLDTTGSTSDTTGSTSDTTDSDDPDNYGISDRYYKRTGIFGIPSGFSIVMRQGQAYAMSMMGGDILGPKGGSDFTIDGPEFGLNLYYWKEGLSQ